MFHEHIISVEFGSNSVDATCDFNTKEHSWKGKIFLNWNVWDEWYNGKKKHKVSNRLKNHFLGIKKRINQLLNVYICIYIICDAFFNYRL
jgi:hypothetical protein